MPERLEAKRWLRTGTALALALGSATLASDAHEEPEQNNHRIFAAAVSRPVIPVEVEYVETTTTTMPLTTTTMETTTTTNATTTTLPPPASEPEPAPVPERYPVGCENYQGLVAQYEWPFEGAMRTMAEESGCDPNAVSATDDHGLFQLHGQPVYDPAENIRIAYGMYVNARRGSHNFSAWYAVCTPDQQPKYPEVNCS